MVYFLAALYCIACHVTQLCYLTSITLLLQAMPVVQMTQEGTLLTLAARNTDEYLHR